MSKLNFASDIPRLLLRTAAFFTSYMHDKRVCRLVLCRFAPSFLIVLWCAYASLLDGHSRGMSFEVSSSEVLPRPKVRKRVDGFIC